MQFLDKDGVRKYGYSTSWGTSTRMIGALIMAHGDERGLVLPPKVAPVQVVIVPVAAHKGGVTEKAEELLSALSGAGVRAELDAREASPGWKFNEWEMKGVPVRIEIGPRDIEKGQACLFRRDTLEKSFAPLESVAETAEKLLEEIQKNMLEKSRRNRDARIVRAADLKELLAGVENKNFVKAGWCGCRECEDRVKDYAAATARVMLEDEESDTCVVCGKKAKHTVVFARAY